MGGKNISQHVLGTKGLADKEIREYFQLLKDFRKAMNKNATERMAVEDLFELPGGLRFFYQIWSSTLRNFDKTPKVLLVCLHGVYGHSDIFYPLADALNPLGVTVAGLDYRGHGRTGGQAGGHLGDFDSFEEVIEDLHQLLMKLQKDYPVPTILLGYDIGALLALRLITQYPELKAERLIFVSPAWQFKDLLKNLIITPALAITQLFKKGNPILPIRPESQDKTLFPEYLLFSAKDYFRLRQVSARFQKNVNLLVQSSGKLKKTNLPCLILQGTKDPIVDHFAVHDLYQRWENPEKLIRFYENAGHNLFADRYTQEMYDEIKQFLRLQEREVKK